MQSNNNKTLMTQSLPLPHRKKQPTTEQLADLQNNLQTLSIADGHHIYYNLSTKLSNSGFFNNDRLIVLDTQKNMLGYVSKLP